MPDKVDPLPRVFAFAPRFMLAISTVLSSWLLMQVIHESGHVLAGILTGGEIRKVVLVPWELSRTDLGQNPHPLTVCWAGPIFGAIAPVAIWLVAWCRKNATAFWFRFLSGFCLIANGSYIGVGAFTYDGDGGDLIRHGSPAWNLILFGVTTIPAGFAMWHGLGKEFGLGYQGRSVSRNAAVVSFLVLVSIIIVESTLSLV